jgi:hypothetical protein
MAKARLSSIESTVNDESLSAESVSEIHVSAHVSGDISTRVHMFERLAVEGQVDDEEKEEVLREISNPKRRHLSMYIKNPHSSNDDVVAAGGGEGENTRDDDHDADSDKERKN